MPDGKHWLKKRGKACIIRCRLISGFTKEPYVECDKETYDDKVFVYMEEEAAKAKAEALKEEKIPVGAAKILSGHMLLFFTNLYTMGVNALEIHYERGSG